MWGWSSSESSTDCVDLLTAQGTAQALDLCLPPGRPPVQRSMRAFCPHMTQNPALQLSAQCPFHTASMHHAAIHSYFSDPNEKRIKRLLSLASRNQSPPEPSKHLFHNIIYSQYTEMLITPILSSQKDICASVVEFGFLKILSMWLPIPSSLLFPPIIRAYT